MLPPGKGNELRFATAIAETQIRNCRRMRNGWDVRRRLNAIQAFPFYGPIPSTQGNQSAR